MFHFLYKTPTHRTLIYLGISWCWTNRYLMVHCRYSCLGTHWNNPLPEELVQVSAAARWPGQVAGVSTFDPFTRHDVWVTRAVSVVVVMIHAHAEDDTWIHHSTTLQTFIWHALHNYIYNCTKSSSFWNVWNWFFMLNEPHNLLVYICWKNKGSEMEKPHYFRC